MDLRTCLAGILAATAGISFSAHAAVTTQIAKRTPVEGVPLGFYGNSVAISGDTAVVGAPQHLVDGRTAGAVYVYVKRNGGWQRQARLVSGDRIRDHGFGNSVAIDGDTIAIGGSYGGAPVYVFSRADGVWSREAKLIAPAENFGNAVALSGSTLVVGAWRDTIGDNQDQGSAFVFERVGGIWSKQARLTAADGVARDNFGLAVAIEGDTVVVGSPGEQFSGRDGAAYVFQRNAGAWRQTARLQTDAADFDVAGFGRAVSVSGERIAVGVPMDNVDSGAGSFLRDAGSVYVFRRAGTTWRREAILHARDRGDNDFLGHAVDLDGDTLLVGAPEYVNNSFSDDPGRAYLFTFVAGTWHEVAKIEPGDGAAKDYFGDAVALTGRLLVIGAFADDNDRGTDAGSAYFYRFDPPGYDFGDAPAPYPTLRIANGARHYVGDGLRLGAAVDQERNGQPDAASSGDDLTGDDEDGVSFLSPLVAGQAYRLDILGSPGIVDAFFDYDCDGDWDEADERVTGIAVPAVALTLSVPAGACIGTTQARFRLTSTGIGEPTGPAPDGEVEDHAVEIVTLAAVTPAPFHFTDRTLVVASQVEDTPSDYVTISGIANGVAPVSITGGYYQLESAPDVRSNGPGIVRNGDRLRVYHVVPQPAATRADTTLTVGGYSDTYSSTLSP
jgi:hypothetical protein